jgi:hypothetical protein
MELMLGLPPMNQLDATATPMTVASPHAGLHAFAAVANNVPLDQMNPEPRAIHDPLLRKNAQASARLPLDRVDACPEDLFNRILWAAMKGPDVPYPIWAVTQSNDVDD